MTKTRIRKWRNDCETAAAKCRPAIAHYYADTRAGLRCASTISPTWSCVQLKEFHESGLRQAPCFAVLDRCCSERAAVSRVYRAICGVPGIYSGIFPSIP